MAQTKKFFILINFPRFGKANSSNMFMKEITVLPVQTQHLLYHLGFSLHPFTRMIILVPLT